MESLIEFNNRYHPERKNIKRSKAYFIHRAALLTGFSTKDLTEVYNAFEKTLIDAIDEINENPDSKYVFGPFILCSRKVGKRTWVDPNTSVEYTCDGGYLPTVKLKPGIKDRHSVKDNKYKNLEEE